MLPMNVNFGGLSKAATVLIEKISDAVGGIAKPWQVVRVAKAEAGAERIRAESRIEIGDLERRAVNRFITEQVKTQQNIETIAQRALARVADAAKPEQVEDDWIVNFFDKCRMVSDDEMQSLWSRILAGEANSPGAFSRKTVNLLADLGKTDAALFSTLCGFVWKVHVDVAPLVLDYRKEFYSRHGIDFDSLFHLESLGLLRFSSLQTFLFGDLPKKVTASYYGRTAELVFRRDTDNEITIGHVLLTRSGLELARVANSGPVDGFFEFVYDDWAGRGLTPSRTKT